MPSVVFHVQYLFYPVAAFKTCLLLRPLEHLDILVLGKTQRIPEAERSLIANQALKASVVSMLSLFVVLEHVGLHSCRSTVITFRSHMHNFLILSEVSASLRLVELGQGVVARAHFSAS